MATFNIINKSTTTIAGGPGEDRLTYTYDTTTNDVWLTDLSADPAGGYTGHFDGMGSNDAPFTGIEHFTFTDLSGGNDIIRTGDGDDVLNGGDGNDELSGGAGLDMVDGGDGVDLWGADLSTATSDIDIDLNTVSTYLGGGSVRNMEHATLTTGAGDDSFTGHDTAIAHDMLDMGAGNDSVTLHFGSSDTVDGGAGEDRLTVTYDVDTNDVWLTNLEVDPTGGYSGRFDGKGSNDIDFTGIEHFTFTDRSGGNDIIHTGGGDDVLSGGDGNDRLISGSGHDTIDGGKGMDIWGADLGAATAKIKINLNKASTYLSEGSVKRIEGLELETGSGNDAIIGHKKAGLNDSISTGAGKDVIKLWAGGTDSVDGGAGTDKVKLIYNVESNGVWLTNLSDSDGGGYSGTFDGMGGTDVDFSHMEKFIFIDKSGGHDIIRTGKGNDVLNGGNGNDELSGAGGKDTLKGGNGNDSLNGGDAKDKINGGRGDDEMSGGAKADIFQFNGRINEGSDTITDFGNKVDRIKVAGLSFEDIEIRSTGGGADTLIVLEGKTEITLLDVMEKRIDADDFLFT